MSLRINLLFDIKHTKYWKMQQRDGYERCFPVTISLVTYMVKITLRHHPLPPIVFVGLDFELRASHLQSRCPTIRATPPVHFSLVIFGDGRLSRTICLDRPWIMSLQILASQVAKYYRCPVSFFILQMKTNKQKVKKWSDLFQVTQWIRIMLGLVYSHWSHNLQPLHFLFLVPNSTNTVILIATDSSH
jgi:hypothetical protein